MFENQFSELKRTVQCEIRSMQVPLVNERREAECWRLALLLDERENKAHRVLKSKGE